MRPVPADGTWSLSHTAKGIDEDAGAGVLEGIEDVASIVETVEDETSEFDDDCTKVELAEDCAFKLKDDDTLEVELVEVGTSELAAEDSETEYEAVDETKMIDDELTGALVEDDERITDDETADGEMAEDEMAEDETIADDDGSALQLPNPGWHPVPQ
jgi:hypothetical protein